MDNQASEDDLYSKLLNLRLTVWRQTNLNGQANLDHDSVEEVLALIRTEKLKLLDKIVGIASNKQFKDYTKQDIASFFSRLGELERELEAEL